MRASFRKSALLAGTASLLVAGAALAQQAPGDAGAVVVQESPMAAIVEEERLDVDGPRADGAGRQTEADLEPAPGTTAEGRAVSPDAQSAAPAVADAANDIAPLADADREGPEAAIVREEIAETGAPHDEAVEALLDDAQEEAIQNDVHVLPTEVNEAEIRPWHIWSGEDETAGAGHLRDFMAMDIDGDQLVSAEEWQAGPQGRTAFAELDVNSSGWAGFAEYRVWLSLAEAEAANDNAAAMGGPLDGAEEPAAAPAPAVE